jgi:uncharacterized protein (DUF58 family)
MAPSVLVSPAARQGPGPMPRSALAELEAAVDRLVAQRLPGERRASGVGMGIELAQLRPYEIGDDVRHLDPAATARSGGIPHVRLHVPERALTTWIVVDLSPSMAFGTTLRLKADVAEGVALALARAGVRLTGSVGLLAFGAGEPILRPPRGARRAVVAVARTLAPGVAPDGAADEDALAQALRRIGRIARQPGLIVIVSDFREQRGWERPLGSLRTRHAVAAVEVLDPAEIELPALGQLALIDPETGARLRIDSSSARLRERFAALERQRRELLGSELRRLRVRHVALRTDQDWLRELGRAL